MKTTVIDSPASLAHRVPDGHPEHAGRYTAVREALGQTLELAELQPITAEMRRLTEDTTYIDGVLKRGAEKARAISEPIMAEVQDIVGFLRP